VQSQASWEAEYQQNPIIVGGGAFPIEKIGHAPYVDRAGVLKSVRYFDKAGTHGDGAHTAGVLMHTLSSSLTTILREDANKTAKSSARVRSAFASMRRLCSCYRCGPESQTSSSTRSTDKSSVLARGAKKPKKLCPLIP
jgi:hypothetical protein